MPSPHFMEFDPAMIGLLAGYSVAIVFASLLGGWLPSVISFTHTRIQVVISFVGGLMLGIAIFHLLPHALVEMGPNRVDQVAWALMAGLLVMFFLLRAFHFHQHEAIVDEEATTTDSHNHDHPQLHQINHPPHGDHHGCQHHKHDSEPGSLRWLGVLIGLGFHTLLDGVALGAAVQADAERSDTFGLWGIGVFLAIVAHKPLDAISITSLMKTEGWSFHARLFANLGFSMMVPLGALLIVLGMFQMGEVRPLVGWGLGFSAGVFLCISLSDLLPEMEFHSHNRIRLTFALLFGIAVSLAIGLVEPKHTHEPHGNIPQTGSVKP